MPANPLTPPRKRHRNPILAQRDARAAAVKAAPKGSGQVAPPAPPNPAKPGPAAPPRPPADEVKKAREALETLPDGELIQKAEVLLPNYEEDWDRTKLVDELLKAGVAG